MVLLGFRVDDAPPVAEVGCLVRWVAVVGLCWLLVIQGKLYRVIIVIIQLIYTG